MPRHLALVLTLDPLGPPSPTGGRRRFGLSLAAAVRDDDGGGECRPDGSGGGCPTAEEMDLLRPWRWEVGPTIHVRVATNPGSPVTAVDPDDVELVGEGAMEGQCADSNVDCRTATTEGCRLWCKVEERFRQVRANPARFLWNVPPLGVVKESDQTGEESFGKLWVLELASYAAWPGPYGQWLNLVRFFDVDLAGYGGPLQVAAAPEVVIRGEAQSFRYEPKTAVIESEGHVKWEYESRDAGAPPLYAYVGFAPEQPSAGDGSADIAVEPDSLWVRRPLQDTLALADDDLLSRPVTGAARGTAQKLAPAPEPHALELQLCARIYDPRGGDGSASDRHDPFRSYSGFLVFLRRSSGTPSPWACLNLARAASIDEPGSQAEDAGAPRLKVEPWGSRPLAVPLRVGYKPRESFRPPVRQDEGNANGEFRADDPTHPLVADVTVAYNNRPLVALSPEALLGNHPLQPQQSAVEGGGEGAEGGAPSSADVDRPPVRYLYVEPSTSPVGGAPSPLWGRTPALLFGETYEFATCAVRNSQALATGLAPPDEPARLSIEPDDLGPLLAGLETTSVKYTERVLYRRRVAVGAPRPPKQAAQGSATFIGLPPLVRPVRANTEGTDTEDEAAIYPLAHELFPPKALATDASTTVPAEPGPVDPPGRTVGELLLLAEAADEGVSKLPSWYEFELLPPTVDLQTWLRWPRPADQPLGAVWPVVEDYYRRMGHNHSEPIRLNPERSESLDIRDPAVTAVGVVLQRFDPAHPAQGWQDVGEREVYSLPPEPLQEVVGSKSGRVCVLVSSREAEGIHGGEGGQYTVGVRTGGIYRLTMAPLVNDADQGRFEHDTYDVGLVDTGVAEEAWLRFPGYATFSPRVLWVEVATREPISEAVLRSIYQEMRVEFDDDVAGVEGRTGEGLARLRVTATLPAPDLAADPTAAYVHGARVRRQRWAWAGRPVSPDDVPRPTPPPPGTPPSGGAAARWGTWLGRRDERLRKWEAQQFGHWVDEFALVDSMRVELAAQGTPGVLAARKWVYDHDFSGDLGASYHRFGLLVYHRYAGAFAPRPLDEVVAAEEYVGADRRPRDPWHSVVVPARPSTPPAEPSIQVVFPLTQRVPASARADAARGEPQTSGVLVVTRGAAFTHGGLAEHFHAEITSTASGSGDGAPAGLPEAAPDPIMSGARFEPSDLLTRTLEVEGPIGHALDSQNERARYRTASYIVRPPQGAGGSALDFRWHMARLRFGRSLDPALVLGDAAMATAEPAWSEAQWVQFLPDFRVVRTGVEVDDLDLDVRHADGVVRLVDQRGRLERVPADADFVPLLFLTWMVVDIGQASREGPTIVDARSEAFYGVYRQDGDGVWHRLPGGRQAAREIPPRQRYRGRLAQVHLGRRTGPEGTPDLTKMTEEELWRRLFGPTARGGQPLPTPARDDVRNRMRIASWSPPIDEPATVPRRQ